LRSLKKIKGGNAPFAQITTPFKCGEAPKKLCIWQRSISEMREFDKRLYDYSLCCTYG
jgi:hypothetical protein